MMIRRGYSILLVGLVLLSGCSDRFFGDHDAFSDRAIVLASDVADAAASRAVAVNGTALTGVQFLRKDGTGAPTDFSGVSAVVGNRATNGNITFTPTVPTYKLNNDRAYFRAYHPAGLVEGNAVVWGVDAQTDILVSSVFDAGTYTTPITGPMVFGHVLAQLEVKCVADPSATMSEALVQFIWGQVKRIELVETSTELTFDYALGVSTGKTAGEVALLQEDYATAFAAVDLTQSGFTAAAMLVPAASGTAPIKLKITTEKQTEEIEVQLKSGSTNMGFAAGLKHTVTLQFNAAEKQILVSATKVSDWAVGYDAAPEVNQPPQPYIEIDDLRWAVGNLVADGVNGCKVGVPEDCGLYFQFGSLVGWRGGANGNGVGTGSSSTLAVWVKPATYSGGELWTTVGRYKEGTTDDKGYNLPTADVPTRGIGDPCRYYLGAPWRTPTAAEYLTLLGADGANTNKAVPLKLTSYDLSFPASGFRDYSGGSLGNVTTTGFYWSSSIYTATNGYYLHFRNSYVAPQGNLDRSYGFPVRCVQPVPTVPNPPAASDYVTIGSLKWTKGNLVAVNGTNAKVGAPEDYGLYFQFGSLVGWNGGATGNGVGTGSSSALGVQVKPSTYSGTSDWTTVGRYTDKGTSNTEYGLPTTDAPTSGIGDPCRVYLGAPWRTPTGAEYLTLLGAAGANTNKAVPLKPTGYDLSFPASGLRSSSSDGMFDDVGSGGYCWSSSVRGTTNGYDLYFRNGSVSPLYFDGRSYGMPVRCVQPVPTTPNPPAASDYVTIGSLNWTKGNLVAVNGTNAKVGAPEDYGLYFQFGSLVGWNGGATGNGVGTGSPALGVQVQPSGYGGTSDWTTVGYYKDDDVDNMEYNLPTTDAPTSGIGDPCRVYLGAPWRTPTGAEYLTLIGADGANTDKAVPLKLNSSDLSFPATGRREVGGVFDYVGSSGCFWGSSASGVLSGYGLTFSSSHVNPESDNGRSFGMPVRCVSSVP